MWIVVLLIVPSPALLIPHSLAVTSGPLCGLPVFSFLALLAFSPFLFQVTVIGLAPW
jgi:hypothetical protein